MRKLNLTAEELIWAKAFVAECDECDKKALKADLVATTVTNKRGETADFLLCKRCFGNYQASLRDQVISDNGLTREEYDHLRRLFASSMAASAAREARFRVHLLNLQDVIDLWVKQKGLCALSGLPMKIGLHNKGSLRVPSIDRIDSGIGYEVGNVQLLCWGVNLMKQDLTVKDFRFYCRKIAAHEIGADDPASD